MDRLARAVEPSLGYRHEMPDPAEEPGVGRAMSNAACDIAETLAAAAILVPTATGKTASAVARLRPRRPIVALTHNQFAVQQMALGGGDPCWSRRRRTSRTSGCVHRREDGGVIETGDRIDDGGDVGEHQHDERDQGRRRVAPGEEGRRRASNRAAMLRFGRRRGCASSRSASPCCSPSITDRTAPARARHTPRPLGRGAARGARKHQLETRLAPIEGVSPRPRPAAARPGQARRTPVHRQGISEAPSPLA